MEEATTQVPVNRFARFFYRNLHEVRRNRNGVVPQRKPLLRLAGVLLDFRKHRQEAGTKIRL
jgi:hypothetical protein